MAVLPKRIFSSLFSSSSSAPYFQLSDWPKPQEGELPRSSPLRRHGDPPRTFAVSWTPWKRQSAGSRRTCALFPAKTPQSAFSLPGISPFLPPKPAWGADGSSAPRASPSTTLLPVCSWRHSCNVVVNRKRRIVSWPWRHRRKCGEFSLSPLRSLVLRFCRRSFRMSCCSAVDKKKIFFCESVNSSR